MRVESNFISIKRKTLSYFVIVVLTLGTVTPVLAYYLGPDRTTTTSEVDTYDYGVWARDNNKAPYCLDKNGNKADDCIVCEWKRKPGNACGDATYSYKLGTTSEVVEKTISLDPATISSSLQNCNSNNGWCNTLPTLTLNGSEPLSGYSILAVEGSLNGQAFACSGSACDVPLNEGNNDFTFWALSSYGDSSQMGTLFAKVDTVSPNVGLDVVGSNGTSNWYVSSTTITATGSDSTSGLSSVLLSVNGEAWTASTTLNDGVYAIDVQAEDNAGNVSTSSTTLSVDTVTPSVSLNVNGTMGGNGWYSSNMQVTANANDLTSGIASLEVSTDGGVYQAYTSPVSFTDGYHTIRFKATDNAGNQTETPMQEFYVDTTAPAIDLPSSWEVNKTIGYNIQDDGSGLAALRIVIEDEDEKYKKIAWDEEVSGNKFKSEITWNGKFKDGTIAPPGEYLVWIKVKDQAGNERFGLGRVVVPQPTVFSLLQPATTNNQETLLPPQELFDDDELPITNSSLTTPPQTSFGGLTTDPKEVTQNSLSLATGTASASTSSNSNILWGATAAAMVGAMTAYALDEKRKHKALYRASRDEQEQANQDEEPPLTRQEKELAKQRKELQKIWDANGAAIYEANREYKAKHGKEMDAAARSKAIKDATRDGVFNAGAYASNLEAEKTRQDAQNERMANKMTRIEKEEEVRWQAQQKDTEEKQKAEELQAGYAAYYVAMRQGEQEAQTNVWDKAVDFVQENIVQPIQEAITVVTTPASSEDVPAPHAPHLAKLTPAPLPLVENDSPWWKKLIEKGKELATKAIQTAKETVTEIVKKGKELVEDGGDFASEKWEDARQWVNTNVIQSVKDTFTDIVTSAVTAMQDYSQRFKIANEIRKEYGWYVNPLYTQTQLKLIQQTGDNMKVYVDGITNNNGDIWMDEYISGVIFLPAGNSPRPFSIGPFIFLNQGWDKYSNPLSMPLTHEFGHVWDWRTGSIDVRDLDPIDFIQDWHKNGSPNIAILTNGLENGVSDLLNTFIGGTVVSQDGNRIEDGTAYKYISDNYLWDGFVAKVLQDTTDDVVIQNHPSSVVFNGGYGNNTTADYLCEAFNAAINNPNAIPNRSVQSWLEDTIRAQTDSLTNETPNPFEELIAKGREKIIETKRWFNGEDVGYQGSGWGHGPRQWVADRLGLDNSVGNLFTLGLRSLLQYDKVSLDGSVLTKIKADPAMQELEQMIIEVAKADPRFGKEPFSLDRWEKERTYEFGGDRVPGDMWEQLKHPLSGLRGNTLEYIETHGLLQTVRDLIDPNKDVIKLNYADTWKVGFNELTWVTRHASVEAQVKVSEQGEIHIDYALEDELDLEPSKDRSSAYNAITKMLGFLYHDILGGNDQMRVQANWSSDK